MSINLSIVQFLSHIIARQRANTLSTVYREIVHSSKCPLSEAQQLKCIVV